MKISFVLANHVKLDPTVDIKQLKELGSFWGGWRTWRECQTDNVVCHDQSKATELIQRNFQNNCNFYIPNEIYLVLDRPPNVKLYEGKFIHDVDNQEDIVSMHLAASASDIILLVGFDFSTQTKLEDRLAEHRANNYRNLTRQAIVDYSDIQWVLLDHSQPIRKDLQNLENLGQDSLINILQV